VKTTSRIRRGWKSSEGDDFQEAKTCAAERSELDNPTKQQKKEKQKKGQ